MIEENNYYEIPISMFWFWLWLIITGIYTIISTGMLFFLLIIPIVIYFHLKNIKYSYNNKEIIIRKGLIFKTNRNIAIDKIEEVNVKLGLLTLVVQAKPITLMNVKNVNKEANKFINIWREK